jgi:phosphatidate cytidylyltransferase
LTGTIFVVITICLILINDWTLLAFLVIANIWLSIEFLRLFKNEEQNPNFISTIIITTFSIIISFVICYFNYNLSGILIIFPLFFIVFIEELFKKNKNPIKNIATSILSYSYLTLSLTFVCLLTIGENFNTQKYLILGIFILIWANDTFAYLFGTAFGQKNGHKLFERISPKKSWEGSIGGGFITIIIAYFINIIPCFSYFSKIDWIIIAIIAIVFGTLGDLIESMFKRHFNVKDSGKLLPGHGGLLDRLDSFIFSIPFVFLYFTLKELIIL